MFANRYTAFVDACVLAGTLRRNLLLTLAEAEFFRVRWSREVLNETQLAIEKILNARGVSDAQDRALRACRAMETAFDDAIVTGFDNLLNPCNVLPDKRDAHVLAAALKTQAAVIVTDNLSDFPARIVEPFGIEACTADSFIANTISLDEGRAISAIQQMRSGFRSPAVTTEDLILKMEAQGLIDTADVLRPYLELL